jgi:hypothetical protein
MWVRRIVDIAYDAAVRDALAHQVFADAFCTVACEASVALRVRVADDADRCALHEREQGVEGVTGGQREPAVPFGERDSVVRLRQLLLRQARLDHFGREKIVVDDGVVRIGPMSEKDHRSSDEQVLQALHLLT